MINILYEHFPDSIQANGKEYKVITNFREWFRFSDMMNDKELSSEEKALLLTEWLLDTPKIVTNELVNAVIDFYRCKELEPETIADENEDEQKQIVKPPVFDWKIDAKFIIGDFLRYYGINLLCADMHWWEFRCLFAALPEDSQCCKRIAYRSIDVGEIKNEAEKRRILRIKQAVAIPFEYDDEMIGTAFEGI